ncbi:hypothetical protein BGZ46_005636, partial [Entomortierella lignicola]
MTMTRNDRNTRNETRARRGTPLQVVVPVKKNQPGIAVKTLLPLIVTIGHTDAVEDIKPRCKRQKLHFVFVLSLSLILAFRVLNPSTLVISSENTYMTSPHTVAKQVSTLEMKD